MDKYERKVRTDEINALIEEGELAQAAKIADTIDWKRERSTMMLCKISDVYKFNKRYEDSRDILLLAYERSPGGRLIVRSLCELSIKLGEYVQALEYYKEFVQLAPQDNDRYILLYKLYEAQDVSLEERITVLEEFKKRDYREKWAYELATLYHQVGLESKCVEECNEIYVMFGDGRYVLKALDLKMLHEPLSEEQQEKYDLLKSGNYPAPAPETEQEETLEEAGMDAEEEEEEESLSLEEKMLAEDTQEIPDADKEMDIQVKTVDVSQYNTINLQRELAESMKEILDTDSAPEQEAEDLQVTRIFDPVGEEDTPVLHQDTDEMKPIAGPEIKSEGAAVQEDSEEVFFGNTSEVNIQDMVSELKGRNESKTPFAPIQEELEEAAREDAPVQTVSDSGKALSNTGIIRTFHKPSGYDEILSQDYDGQISLVVPEEAKVEKQITGQLSIEDIMAEWEKIKQDRERKRMEEIRKRVQQQTNTLFADFDESTKSGLLEELEKAMVSAASKDPKFVAIHSKPKVVKFADMEKKEVKLEEPLPDTDLEAEDIEEAAGEEIQETAAPEKPDIEETIQEEREEVSKAEEIRAEEAEENTEDIEDTEEDMEDAQEAAAAEEASAGEDSQDAEEEAEDSFEKDAREEAKAKEREMTAGEREQFAPFIHHKKTRRQIVEAIDNISMASYTGNVIISGEEGTGRIALAKLLVKEIQLSDNNFSGKVAKISGTTMNKKDVPATLSKLANGALIIESAASMKENTVKQLRKELDQEEKGLIVLLEDSKTRINEFLAKYPEIITEFNLRVDVEALDDQTLVKYAKKYALEQEYAIDDLGVLALHTRIAEMQTSDHEVTLAEIEELVDEAIYYADKKTPKHFLDILVGKRYDEEDMIVLREKDFMHN